MSGCLVKRGILISRVDPPLFWCKLKRMDGDHKGTPVFTVYDDMVLQEERF